MSALSEFLNKNGRFPPVSIMLKPLDPSKQTIKIKNFLSYNFQSSIIIPIDSFQFQFTNPSLEGSILDFIREGDTVVLLANEVEMATGIIDVLDIETTENGEMVTLIGRDLMGQLEDHSAVSIQGEPIYGNDMTLSQAVDKIRANTKIKALTTQNAPSGSYTFATDPSESKLSALLRFIEPLNCLAWTTPDGKLRIGRPNFAQSSKGRFVMDREKRKSNCLSIKSTRSGTQIPNIIVPIWSGQETVQTRVTKEQIYYNKSEGAARLRGLGYVLPKAVVTSTPNGTDPQSLAELNRLQVAQQQKPPPPGGSNILQAYMKKEMARYNMQEHVVQVIIKGHFNDDLDPILVDQVYNIFYPRAGVDKKMYLYQVSYELTPEEGPRTSLYFCNLFTIVSDNKAQ